MLCTTNRETTTRGHRTAALATALLLVAAAAPLALAQKAYESLPWASTQGPLGGLGYDIRYNFDDASVWYVTDAWSGVHRSTDRGITWAPSNEGISIAWGPAADAVPIFSLTVDPNDPDVVWAGTQYTGQIFKSTDGGITWTEKSNGIDTSLRPELSIRGFTVDPTDSDTVYAMAEIGSPSWTADGSFDYGLLFDKTKGLVYRTRDGGENWTEIWRGDNLARYCWIDPTNTDVLYVSTGIFDREAANTDVDLMIPGGVGILKSTDGGDSWQVFDEANGFTDLYIGSLFMHPTNPQILLAAAGHDEWSFLAPEHTGGVFRTTDGGVSWTRVLAGELFSVVEFCPSNPDVAYAGSTESIHRSDDAGITWHRYSREDGTWGSPGLAAGFPIDVQCDPDDPMRVAINNYLGGNFLSRDGGETWQSMSQGYTGALVKNVAVSPVRAATVVSSGRSGGFRSEDGAGHWVPTHYPPPELTALQPPIKLTEFFVVIFDPADPDRIIASSEETPELLVSEDTGRSWELVPFAEGLRRPLTMAFAPADSQVVYAGSCDWTRCRDQSGAHPEECNAPGSGFALSEDGGLTWFSPPESALRDTAVLVVEPHPLVAGTVLAGTHSDGLMRSVDSGVTWEEIGAGLPDVSVLDLAIHPLDPGVVYAGLRGAALYKSVDGGETFVQSSTGLEPNANIFSVAVDGGDLQIVYAADDRSGVYVSTDAGATWQAINDGLEHRAVRSLALSSDGSVLYAGVKGAGVWRLGEVDEQPAANDTCDRAIEIGLGIRTELFSYGGANGDASCAGSPGADLWYRHTASADGTLHVNTCGSHDVLGVDSGVDTVVSLHTGCPGTASNELIEGCSDDWTTGSDPAACSMLDTGTPGDGAVAVEVEEGDQVWIRVARLGTVTQGEFWLTVNLVKPPGLPAPRRSTGRHQP
jgi:photosystem II stability/assembly factor-like uncharacterized protein